MNTPEILAPAGSPTVLIAALRAGADAVYFGLQRLNARRGATNFTQEALPETVRLIHEYGARAHLTLNISLSQRELGLAYRTLQCAQDAGVDAVLITDPALIAVIPFFPRLQFHVSTQAGISSSAGVRAARELGFSRAVLARELSAKELRAAHQDGIETEAFVQGAHCFSCSGRCWLSSWGGGRSGNRGACTSPCRVRWTTKNGQTLPALSMHDMSLLPDVHELLETGVASWKIEGRLKSETWVAAAVALYKQALLPNAPLEELQQRARSLGNYTGRELSDAFFRGNHEGLTGDSGRVASTCECANLLHEQDEKDTGKGAAVTPFRVECAKEENTAAVVFTFDFNGLVESLRIPPQRIANPKRAVSLQDIADALLQALPAGAPALDIVFDSAETADILVPKSIRNNAMETLAGFYRRAVKKDDGGVRNVALPEALRARLERPSQPCPANALSLGSRPTHLRLSFEQLVRMEDASRMENFRWIVTVNPQRIEDVQTIITTLSAYHNRIDEVALPEVVYEEQLQALRLLLEKLPAELRVEVNSWDTWFLAREANRAFTAGAGFVVLNAQAARSLEERGCHVVTVTPEIDSEQLEELSKNASTPLAIIVYSHPKLMQTRAVLTKGFRPEDNAVFTDARNLTLRSCADGQLTVLRPVEPMDWRGIRNKNVKAARLIVDLTGILGVPTAIPALTQKPFLFNYDRRLR